MITVEVRVKDEESLRHLAALIQTERISCEIMECINGKKLKPLNIPYAGGRKLIPLEEISYIESYNHKITIHTKGDEIEYYARLSDLEMELFGQFFRIHKGYLVNFDHVKEYGKSKVILKDGTNLPISKYKYAEFVKEYQKYI